MVSYLSPSDVADLVKNESESKFVIIDVRDSDFRGGHIKNCLNRTEDHFHDDSEVDELVEQFKTKEKVVFHCMMSQIRGPFCAKRFASRVEVQLENEPQKPQVFILKGGFTMFARMYKDDPELCEGVTPGVWG